MATTCESHIRLVSYRPDYLENPSTCLSICQSVFLSVYLSVDPSNVTCLYNAYSSIDHPSDPSDPSIHPSIHPYQHIYLYRYVRIDPGFYWSFGVRLQEVLPRKISEPIVDTSFGHVWSAGAMLVLRNVSCIIYYVNL